MRKWTGPLLVALLLGTSVARLTAQSGPFASQIENFWRLISTGGRTFTTLNVTNATCTGTCTGFGGGNAPSAATYLVQTANASLPNAQAMSALATGIVKNTTATGVQSIAVAADLPGSPYLPTGSALSGATGINGAANASRLLAIAGSFTGSVDSVGFGIGPSLTGLAANEAIGIRVDPTLTATAGQVIARLAGLEIQPTFVSGGGTGTATGTQALYIRTYAAPAGLTTLATGLSIDGPTGGTTNYGLSLSGTLELRGSTPIFFEQAQGTTDDLIAGATGAGSYITGSATGDLIIRANTHNILFSIDGGVTANLKLSTAGLLTTGAITMTSTLTTASAISVNGNSLINDNGAGILLIRNGAATSGINFDINTADNTLKVKNRANNADGAITAAAGTFSGAVTSTSATGGVGYATGAGGTITQLTSRTTAVTLNKTTGQITMFSAAGSATAASFTVSNTSVAVGDTIVLSVQAATNLYELFVTNVANNSFQITFFTTGGTATDAPIINFAVVKAVAS